MAIYINLYPANLHFPCHTQKKADVKTFYLCGNIVLTSAICFSLLSPPRPKSEQLRGLLFLKFERHVVGTSLRIEHLDVVALYCRIGHRVILVRNSERNDVANLLKL